MSTYKSSTIFQAVLELSKVKITIAVAFTTLTGYILSKQTIDWGVILPVLGIFLLACGSSVVNHLQERKTDANMERTKMRPLPSGKVSLKLAVIIALFELLSGAFLLMISSGIEALLLGLSAVFWYNVIYTYLKKITVHAVIPGSIIGAIPPLVGWISANGSLSNPYAWIMALFFFIWQVPHFYLLALLYANDYKTAGFPSLLNNYTLFQVQRMIFYWVAATAMVSMLMPMFEVTKSYITLLAIGFLSLRILYIFLKPLMKPSTNYIPGKYFMKINYYVLSIVVILIFDHILVGLI